MLKAAQALSHYQGGHMRNVTPHPSEKEDEPDIRLDFIRPQRLKRGFGFGPGWVGTKVGNKYGWEDVGSGRTVDSPINRFTGDPYEDTPRLSKLEGREYKSPTKWDKRKSGSQ